MAAQPPTTVAAAPPIADGRETRALSPATLRRNYRLGVANGVLFTVGEALSSASLVLALLVRELGGSLALVGLLPALQSGGYLLPQLLVGGRLQAMPRKMRLYHRAAIARLAAYGTLLIAVFFAASVPRELSLLLIVVCFSIFTVGGGTSTLAFQDIVAKVIPPRRRGSFFGTRQLFGGLLAFVLVGPLVRWLLGEASPLAFPANYGALCLLGLFGFAGGLLAFSLIDEPPQLQTGPRLRLGQALRRAPTILREHDNYRWFIVSRMLTRAGQIAEPFYIIYATEALGLPAGVAGIYLAVRAITGALSNLVWSRISARSGDRRLVLLSGVLVLLTPALALLGPAVARFLGTGSDGLMAAMALVFLVSGAANDGTNLAASTYLLDIVPDDERPTYMGLANTALGVVTFLPVLGGWLVANAGYGGTFIFALVFGLLGLLASMRLGETGLRVGP
jgi:MFS family permease